jgi:hypothetical protein
MNKTINKLAKDYLADLIDSFKKELRQKSEDFEKDLTDSFTNLRFEVGMELSGNRIGVVVNVFGVSVWNPIVERIDKKIRASFLNSTRVTHDEFGRPGSPETDGVSFIFYFNLEE